MKNEQLFFHKALQEIEHEYLFTPEIFDFFKSYFKVDKEEVIQKILDNVRYADQVLDFTEGSTYQHEQNSREWAYGELKRLEGLLLHEMRQYIERQQLYEPRKV